jgi:hypothetical protein
MAQPAPEHQDLLGRPIALDSMVAYPSSNSMLIGRVIKLNNKMIKVVNVTAKSTWGRRGINKYPQDCVVVDGDAVTMYLLKQQ